MTSKIVVGVDGSPHARRALEWAADEARRRGSRLSAVHAWMYPYLADLTYMAPHSLDRNQIATDAKNLLASALDDALGADRGQLQIEEHVVEGSAVEALLREAADAELLVIGTRGRGGFRGLLLGSVSLQCAHHSPCPVVIVP